MGQAFGILLILAGATMWHIAVGRSQSSSDPNPLLGLWTDFGKTAQQLTGGAGPDKTFGNPGALGGDQQNGTTILS